MRRKLNGSFLVNAIIAIALFGLLSAVAMQGLTSLKTTNSRSTSINQVTAELPGAINRAQRLFVANGALFRSSWTTLTNKFDAAGLTALDGSPLISVEARSRLVGDCVRRDLRLNPAGLAAASGYNDSLSCQLSPNTADAAPTLAVEPFNPVPQIVAGQGYVDIRYTATSSPDVVTSVRFFSRPVGDTGPRQPLIGACSQTPAMGQATTCRWYVPKQLATCPSGREYELFGELDDQSGRNVSAQPIRVTVVPPTGACSS